MCMVHVHVQRGQKSVLSSLSLPWTQKAATLFELHDGDS